VRVEPNPHASPAENERFAAFLHALESEGLSPGTRACYASDWWNVSEDAHEAKGRPFRIDRYRAEDFLAYRAREAARGVSPATLNRRLAFLRRYAGHLRLQSAGLDRVPFQPVVRASSRWLSTDEETRLRKAAQSLGSQPSAIVALLLGTGMRASEAANLRRGDVDGPVEAPRSLRVRGPRRKVLLLGPRAAEALAAHLGPASEGARASDPVFLAADGTAASESRIASIVSDTAKAAGVEATPRTLRHTFAVRYLQEHRDDVEGLARALGQSGLAQARAYREEANERPPDARRVRWGEVEVETVSPTVSRRVVRGARIEAIRYVYEPGAEFPSHSHPEEQMTFVLSGRIAFRSGRRTIEAGPGDVVHVPPGVPHAARVVGARRVVTLNVFSPVRRVLPDGRPT
jgi:integrase